MAKITQVSPHENHRKRVKKKISDGYIASFADHELLEFMLFHVIKRSDVNPLAHRLIKHFKGLKNILGASRDDLLAVDGVGDSVANYLVTAGELYKRAAIEKVKVLKLNSSEKICKYLLELFAFETKERMYAICLDKNYNLICNLDLSFDNERSEAKINVVESSRKILLQKSSFVVLAHNHLQDGVNPTQSDINITKQFLQRLYVSGVVVCDHIIVNGDAFLSFAEQGWFKTWLTNITEADYENTKKLLKMPDMISSGGVKLAHGNYNLEI